MLLSVVQKPLHLPPPPPPSLSKVHDAVNSPGILLVPPCYGNQYVQEYCNDAEWESLSFKKGLMGVMVWLVLDSYGSHGLLHFFILTPHPNLCRRAVDYTVRNVKFRRFAAARVGQLGIEARGLKCLVATYCTARPNAVVQQQSLHATNHIQPSVLNQILSQQQSPILK